MNQITLLTSEVFQEILSAPRGFDLDHDGQREFIFRTGNLQPGGFEPIEFYESIADNTFVLAYTIDPAEVESDTYIPTDVGDIDGDDLSDLVLLTRDHLGGGMADYGMQVFEGASTSTYPTELAWQVITSSTNWTRGGLLGDTDADGKQEIVVIEPAIGGELVLYENNGDNSYAQTYSQDPVFLGGPIQSFALANDLDGDGHDEILIGGGGFDSIVAFESIGDNTYEQTWSVVFDPGINVVFIIDAGDLDGDGKKELLSGGLGFPDSWIHVLESFGNNQVEVVNTFTLPASSDFYTSANVADVDGDGRKEIVVATGSVVKIYENTGDNTWAEIWSGTGNSIQAIGAGDHDQDGKDEIIFREGSVENGSTGIWEIDPAYQADRDEDDVVDVIDNCPMDFNPDQDDYDGDGVGDLCDNCLHGPNPAQGMAPLGQQILATDSQTFSWSLAADVVYVRGGLLGVSTYAVDTVNSLALATSLTDGSPVAGGAGFYYLVRPDCLVGSWQTIVGSEPERDLFLP